MMGLSLSAPIRSAAPVRRGGIRAAAGSPSPGIGSRNGGGVGVPKLPALIAIAGYTGSGKTSLAKMLVRRLDFQMVVLSTTRSPAANEVEGVDYNFLDEKTFMEGLQSGEIIGCEGGYGAYYGVSRSQLEDIITSGKSGAVVVGASLMDSLRADLAPRGDVRFRSVLVRLPGTPQQRYDEIVRRIEKRAAEEGRDAADRLAKVSLDALQAYDGRADYFDFELENGDFKAAGQAMRDYVETVWEGGTTGKTERVLIRNTPEVNLGRYLLRRLEEKIDQALDQIDLSSYESIRAGVDEHLSEELLALLTSVLREYHGESAMAGHMQESLARTHRHILNVAICILQNKEQLAQLMEEKMGLGKLAAIEDTSRARANLERLLAISGRYSTKHLLWLALLHDVTKMASLHLHPERSYELLDRFSLFKELAWSAEDKNIYRVALRYHILLTACFMPDLSAQAFVDFLKDPQVQQLLAPLGVVDAVTAEKLLDSILLLTVADVASYGPALTNFKVELILRHRNMILEVLRQNPDKWGDAVRQMETRVPGLSRQHLAGIIGISDPQMDTRESMDYYWQIVERRMQELIASGDLAAEERDLILGNIHLITSTSYPPYNYLARLTPDGEIAPGLTQSPSLALFKFMAFGARLAKQLYQPGRALRFCFLTGEDKYISDREKLKAAVARLARTDEPEFVIEENGVEGAREINFILRLG